MQDGLSSFDILVVDASAYSFQLLRNVLSSSGVKKIRHAVGTGGAADEMKKRSPNLIMVSEHPGEVSGIAFIAHVRKMDDSKLRRIPIILVTEQTDRATVERARDAGVNAVVSKPLSVAKIEARLCAIKRSPQEFIEGGPYFGPERRRNQHGFENRKRRSGDRVETGVVEI